MKILGIETSCDETAVAVVDCPDFKVLGSALNSQIEMHREYGGVYPNVAKREHIKNLPIILDEALKKACLRMEDIDAIAVTVGPGLEPALWTGIVFAKELSERYEIPLIPTNHMEGHICSVLLEKNEIQFPALALLISGGHTELVLMRSWTDKRVIGQTKDDAVGEAFDKVARMLGLPYPGGPEISKLAEAARKKNMQLETKLPRPMLHSGDYNFSFSGLKTAVLYYLRSISDNPLNPPYIKGEENTKKVAREFEDAVTEVLISKSIKAIDQFNPKTFIIGGGVIANHHLRKTFEDHLNEAMGGPKLLIPAASLAGDNAVMIAIAGYLTNISGKYLELKAQGNLKIG